MFSRASRTAAAADGPYRLLSSVQHCLFCVAKCHDSEVCLVASGLLQMLLWYHLQDWQAEVSAMMARAEQLKILLAHRQAHHISLLAAVLQHLHRAEVQEFDRPPQQQLLQTAGYTAKRLNSLSSQLNSGLSSTAATGSHGVLKAVRTGSVGQQQQQQQASIVVAAGFEAAADVLKHIEDEFYMPVSEHMMQHLCHCLLGLRFLVLIAACSKGCLCRTEQ